jgi:hypothetical protein
MLPASLARPAGSSAVRRTAGKSRRSDGTGLPMRAFRQHFGAISEKSPDGTGNVRANGGVLVGL